MRPERRPRSCDLARDTGRARRRGLRLGGWPETPCAAIRAAARSWLSPGSPTVSPLPAVATGATGA